MKTFELFAETLAANRDGLSRQQTRDQTILLRVMPSDREACGFFAAEDDLVFNYQFADELETYRRFVNLQAAILCNPVN